MLTGSVRSSGSRRLAAFFCGVLWLGAASACHHESPTEPFRGSLAGTWTTSDLVHICVGDWHTVTLVLRQSGSEIDGEVTTLDGMHFPVTGTFENGAGRLEVYSFPQPNAGMCDGFDLEISTVTAGPTGEATAFGGTPQGRCCGTLNGGSYRFVRSNP